MKVPGGAIEFFSSLKNKEELTYQENQQNTDIEFNLWKEFKTGREEAFITIYRRYFQHLYAYGHQFTKDANMVEIVSRSFSLDCDLKEKN